MRKIGNESTAPSEGADRDNSGNGWFTGHRCVLALGIIVVVAFLLRFVFAYGVSADGNFALSGGSSAQYHLHVIEMILNGNWSIGADASVNYPVGGTLFIPPLMDLLGAGVATIFGGSMGTTEAASMSLAVLNPIFGALACIPVYLIGKEMYDKTIGVLAALVFAFLALPISTSVFSSGCEYALASFLLAFMAYFLVKMVKVADSEASSKKGILMNGAIAGIFLMLAALTWNGFRIAVVLLAVAMVLQAVSARVRGKDFNDISLGFIVAMLIGAIVPAAYYVPAGLMESVYSGTLLIAIVSVVFVLAFLGLRSKPWVVTIPGLVIAFVIICAVLALAAPEIFNDFIFGNSLYASSIMEQLASNRVSMSNVAAYYGWLTMWMPACLALYETYVYLRRDRTATRLFMIVWLFVMFFATWSSYAVAAVVGSVFAVGSAAAIVLVLREANLKDWAASVKSAGFPGCFRKLIKPLPFISVLVVALLVVVPNVSFAVDAGQPTNTEGDHYFTGNTSFTIKTGDSYPMGAIWDSYADVPKDSALVTWIDYAYDAAALGGFDSVTDANGGGATAAAQVYLAEGSAGAISAMMLRIMMADSDRDYAKGFTGNEAVYNTIRAYINGTESAVDEVFEDPETYGKVRSDVTTENAVYMVCINELMTKMSQTEITAAYEYVCDSSDKKIGYVLLDGSMLPLQYNDGGDFSTIAYFADYALDGYGAVPEFFTYNPYYGYTTYTEALYDTMMWRSIIGPSAAEAGYKDSYSYLVALSASDGSEGSAKAIPGYGLAGFDVASWQVMYNADDKATASTDGWKYMDATEAMKLQETDGGMINYLYGIVMLEYTGSVTAPTLSGSVTDMSGKNVDGATVAVYQYSDVYGKDILFSEARTIDGAYNVLIPQGDYRVDVKIGGLVLESFTTGSDVVLPSSSVTGEVQVNGEIYAGQDMTIILKSDVSEEKYDVVDGIIDIEFILPGTYSYTLFGQDASSLGTGSITVYPGDSIGFVVTPKTYTITVTANDINKKPIDGTAFDSAPIATVTDTTKGTQFSAEIGENGKAVITVVPGTYSVSLGNGLVSVHSNTVNATSNRSATVTAYTSKVVSVTGANDDVALIMSAGEFSIAAKTLGGALTFDVPYGLATDAMNYSIYGFQNGKIVYGTYTGGDSVALKSADFTKVTGTLKDGDKAIKGTVTLYTASGFAVSAATDSDGKFTLLVPAGESYTVYANNGSDKVYLGTTKAAGGSVDLSDLKVVKGMKVTYTLKFDPATSSSSENLPFVLALASFTYEGTDYVLTSMTNTSGKTVFVVPEGKYRVSANNVAGTLSNAAFECTELYYDLEKGASKTSTIEVIKYENGKPKADADQKNVVKEQNVSIPYDMTLTAKEDKSVFVVKKGETKSLRPGQYEAVIDGSTGAYFSGTIYLRPGQTQFVGLDDVEEVVTVKINKNEAGSVVIDSEGSYHSFTGGYYFQTGYSYFLTSTEKAAAGEPDKICYGYIDIPEGSTQAYTVDLTATAPEMEISGYVGLVADGTLYVTIDGPLGIEADIKAGAYTFVLPSNITSVDVRAEVSTTVDSEVYTFVADGTFSGLKDGSIRNISVLNGDFADPEETEAAGFDVAIGSATFSEGDASVQLTITNNTDSSKTYLISTGPAWSLERAESVNVGANTSASINVLGHYDDKRVAPGQDGVTIIVKDINGKETVTKAIDMNSAVGSADVTLDKGAEPDKVSASQYMYAVTLVNSGVGMTDVPITVKNVTGWAITIMDADGTFVGVNGSSVPVYGLETVTYYISLMQTGTEAGAEAVPVPGITADIGGESVNFTPVDIDVEVEDSNVTGGDALNERSGIPAGIWILVAFIILMMIATIWLSSKRGGRR